MISDIVAIIRAAGRGKRLGDLGEYYQKCALPIDGRPLIIHWIESLRICGLDRHVIVGWRANQVMDAVQTYEKMVLKDDESFTTSSMSRLNGIWEDTCLQIKNLSFLQSRHIMLCYADNWSTQLYKIIARVLLSGQYILNGKFEALAAFIPNVNCSSRTERVILGERIVLDRDIYRVLSYQVNLREDIGWAWAGLAIFSPRCFSDRGHIVDTTTVLSSLAYEGKLAAIKITEPYIDVMQMRETKIMMGEKTA